MLKFARYLVLTLLLCTLSAPQLLAQLYPMPGSKSEAAVPCTGCTGTNVSGQNNDGLPTYPYAPPLLDHVGRYVDSNTTPSTRTGYRTARARFIEVAKDRRGSAPPRVYVQIGNGVGVYSLDTFFTSRLPGGMVSIGSVFPSAGSDAGFGRNPLEKFLNWDAFVYPEAGDAGWQVPGGDFQDPFGKLHPIDFDDRGNVLIGTQQYGWGIVLDAGQTTGAHLKKVVQLIAKPDARAKEDKTGVSAHTVLSLKVGSKYYAVIADTSNQAIWDVTNAASPSVVSPVNTSANDGPVGRTKLVGAKYGIIRADRYEDSERVAFVGGDSRLYVYRYADLVSSGAPIAEYSAPNGFADVAFDESGTLWAVENKQAIWKLTPSGNGYTSDKYTPFGGDFEPLLFHAHAGYIAVGGVDRSAGGNYDVKVLRIEANAPKLLDLDGFFRKYYHAAPSGYAQPGQYTSILQQSADVQIVKSGGKTYLMYSGFGLGDVFELEGGNAINLTAKPSYGTANQHSKQSVPGPFYGDILTFVANSSSTTTAYDVIWDFGDSTANGRSRTGEDEVHQYTGLTTAGQITSPKLVRGATVQDPSIQAQLTVNLKLPTPRVGIFGVDEAIAASTTGVEVVGGGSFTDASDGVREGHYSIWTRDTEAPANGRPQEMFPVGAPGPHTLKFETRYGAYDSVLNLPSPYVPPALTIGYTVVPFKVTLGTPVKGANGVTFTATAATSTDLSMFANGAKPANWTVSWKKNGVPYPLAAGTIGTNAVQTVPFGTIPPQTFAETLTDNTIISVEATVLPTDLATSAVAYVASTASLTLSTPDPDIEVTGCGNANSACKFTAKSATGKAQTGWIYLWTLTRPSGAALTGTGATFEPALTAPGNYTITLKVTKTVFDVEASKQLTVGGSLCGPLPNSFDVTVGRDACSGTCAPGTTVNFFISYRGYSRQTCDVYEWTLPDGSKSAAETVSYQFNSPGTHTVSVRISNSGTATPLVKTANVTVGNTDNNPTCTAPTTASFTYTGSGSCSTGASCRTTDTITFSARRGTSSLQSCDNVSWNFGTATSTQRTPTHQFTTAGSYPVTLTVSNSLGSTDTTQTITILPPATGNCLTAPAPSNFVIEYTGAQSACDNINRANCAPGETISFRSPNYFYTVGSCDSFLWEFGDNTTSTERNPTHTFAGGRTYAVKLTVSNGAGSYPYTRNVPFPNQTPTKPVPTITASTFPSTGHKGRVVTFTATSSLPTTTKGWTWNFGDGTASDSSQAGSVSQTSTITHTFTKNGTFTVKATAWNSEETVTPAPVGTAQANITITEPPAIPEYKFLLPATAYLPGDGGTAWRTDVQIYHSDPQVSEAKPLIMEATFKGISKTLTMIKATHSYENFLGNLLDLQKSDQGPVIITTKNTMTPPQIWTRTYNQTANGTFGQYIPAIRIDNLGGAGATGDTKYYMSGLRDDADYRTNVGFLNPNATAMVVTVTVYDAAKFSKGSFQMTLQPFQIDPFRLKARLPELPDDEPFSIKIDVPAGNWLVGYASFINNDSGDPVYIQAIPESDVASADFKTTVLPGVGHTGQWRSDVTIFNPDPDGVMFDLEYYDANGVKQGGAPNVPLASGQFLQYGDILKQGVLGSAVPDGLGTLKVIVKDNHEKYPMVSARTYFDNGAAGTYGQGIPGFSAARANVKAGKHAIIAGVRNTDAYRTNIGLMNVSNAPVTATVTLLDPTTGAAVSAIQYPLQPNQTIVGAFNGWGAITQGTFKIEATGALWAFASIVDRKTFDPEYVAAIPIP